MREGAGEVGIDDGFAWLREAFHRAEAQAIRACQMCDEARVDRLQAIDEASAAQRDIEELCGLATGLDECERTTRIDLGSARKAVVAAWQRAIGRHLDAIRRIAEMEMRERLTWRNAASAWELAVALRRRLRACESLPTRPYRVARERTPILPG